MENGVPGGHTRHVLNPVELETKLEQENAIIQLLSEVEMHAQETRKKRLIATLTLARVIRIYLYQF